MRSILIFRVFAILITIFYCILVWYAMALWSTLSSFDPNPSLFTQLAIEPLPALPIYLHAIHWQIAAIGWLAYNFYSEKNHELSNIQNAEQTLLLQLSWIMISIFIHTLGTLIPMIAIGYRI